MSQQPTNEKYRAEEILILFSRNDEYEPITASEVADYIGCSRRTALNKLKDLERDNEVRSKKVGGRSRVWWRPEFARRDNLPIYPESVDQIIENIELPGAGEVLQERKEAVKHAYEYLFTRQVAGATEIREAVYDSEAKTGGYSDATTLWTKALLPGLKQIPGLRVPGPGGKWRFVHRDMETNRRVDM